MLTYLIRIAIIQGMPDHAPAPLPGPATSPPPHPHPNSLADLFWSFTVLALQGFGGVVAVVQRELVDKKQWLTREEFLEEWAVAQILPGPNVANLALMIGDRYFGWRGALMALAGMLTFPLLVVLALAASFAGIADTPTAQGALRGMGAVTAALITSTALKLAGALMKNVMGARVCIAIAAITFIAVGWFRLPLIWVLLGIGSPAYVWAYRQLGSTTGAKA